MLPRVSNFSSVWNYRPLFEPPVPAPVAVPEVPGPELEPVPILEPVVDDELELVDVVSMLFSISEFGTAGIVSVVASDEYDSDVSVSIEAFVSLQEVNVNVSRTEAKKRFLKVVAFFIVIYFKF